jgi:hypothetical protein
MQARPPEGRKKQKSRSQRGLTFAALFVSWKFDIGLISPFGPRFARGMIFRTCRVHVYAGNMPTMRTDMSSSRKRLLHPLATVRASLTDILGRNNHSRHPEYLAEILHPTAKLSPCCITPCCSKGETARFLLPNTCNKWANPLSIYRIEIESPRQ